MPPLRQQLRQHAAAEMTQDSAHDLAHLDRVWENAQRIAATVPDAETTALLAASYLHDLINLPKDDPERHMASRRSALAATPFMHHLNLTPAQIKIAQHAIEAHSFSAGIPPQSPEAEILRDADRLDALGAIGIARWFSVSGGLNRPIHDGGDPFAQSRTLDDQSFSLDHWRVKLQGLADGMLTQAGKHLAAERLGAMEVFLQQLADELGRDLPADWKTMVDD